MKYCWPYKEKGMSFVSQHYSNTHKGTDFASTYGTFLVAPERVRIRQIITPTNISEATDDLNRGYGIWMDSTSDPGISHLYWHCLPIFPVEVGQIVEQGKIVAQMGNSGFVISNGKVVTIADRLKPPYYGTHLHWESRKDQMHWNAFPYIDRTILITYTYLDKVMATINILKKMLTLKGR